MPSMRPFRHTPAQFRYFFSSSVQNAQHITITKEELVFRQWIRSPRYFPTPPSALGPPRCSRDGELVGITSTPVHLSLIDYKVKPVYLASGVSYARLESGSKLLLYAASERINLPFDVRLSMFRSTRPAISMIRYTRYRRCCGFFGQLANSLIIYTSIIPRTFYFRFLSGELF